MRLFALLASFLILSIFLSFNIVMAAESLGSNVSEVPEVPEQQNLDATFKLNKEKFFPGEAIILSGEVKSNGADVEGSVIIKFGDEYMVPLKYGRFKWESMLPENARSGKHEIKITVKTKNGEEYSFEQEAFVSPVPNRLEIYLSSNSFFPESEINTSAILRDQNSEPIDSEIVLSIYDSRGATIVQKTIYNGEDLNYLIPRDAVPGEWWVYAFSKEIKSRKFFHIEEYPKISVEIKGDTLRVKNVGNVVYNKPLEINFLQDKSSAVEKIDLRLGIGEERLFELTAPDGYYEIIIDSKDFDNSFKGIALTGGAIGIKTRYTAEQILVLAMFVFLILIAGAVVKFRQTISQILEKALKVMS